MALPCFIPWSSHGILPELLEFIPEYRPAGLWCLDPDSLVQELLHQDIDEELLASGPERRFLDGLVASHDPHADDVRTIGSELAHHSINKLDRLRDGSHQPMTANKSNLAKANVASPEYRRYKRPRP